MVSRSTLTTKAGFLAYCGKAGKWVVAPALLGKIIGSVFFANTEEAIKLDLLQSIYRRELIDYQRELYYT